jgi:hypothetical protein
MRPGSSRRADSRNAGEVDAVGFMACSGFVECPHRRLDRLSAVLPPFSPGRTLAPRQNLAPL